MNVLYAIVVFPLLVFCEWNMRRFNRRFEREAARRFLLKPTKTSSGYRVKEPE